MEEKKFEIILADPPWHYNFSKSRNRRIENHYGTMSLQDICALQVPSTDNSVLYLWATFPKLKEALEVMEAWGFTYKSGLSWDKLILGMGYWWRIQNELLLTGTKGKFSPPPPELRKSSSLREKRRKHSQKPVIIKEWIELWYPNCSKLEMFAREKREGWASWGNEIDSDVSLDSGGGSLKAHKK